MTIVETYSSWTRNRITPELRERIRSAGPGEVRFGPKPGNKPMGWVSCAITAPDGSGSAAGRDPAAAFDAAVIELSVDIVSVLSRDGAA